MSNSFFSVSCCNISIAAIILCAKKNKMFLLNRALIFQIFFFFSQQANFSIWISAAFLHKIKVFIEILWHDVGVIITDRNKLSLNFQSMWKISLAIHYSCISTRLIEIIYAIVRQIKFIYLFFTNEITKL